jgi:hypothetical protein
MIRLASFATTVLLGLAVAIPASAGGGLRVDVRLKGSDTTTTAIALGGFAMLSAGMHSSRAELPVRRDAAFVIIDVTPPNAQIFLDGRFLGSSRDVVARAFPVARGRHAVDVVAKGFRPYRAEFPVDGSFPARIRVALQPE